MERVQKILSSYGYCSRRKGEKLIKEGRVKVNGKTISIGDKATKEDDIYVDDKLIEPEKKVYFKFNKPKGCVTALKDPHNKTIMDYIDIKQRVFHVGRLDKDTSGLLLLTNDGDFANRVMHPRHEVNKTYLVKINKPIKKEYLKQIEQGVELEDGRTSPAKVKKLGETLIKLTIHEGKNRIIKRIFDKFDRQVLELKRTAIGNVKLDGLKPGQYKKLSEKEKSFFR